MRSVPRVDFGRATSAACIIHLTSRTLACGWRSFCILSLFATMNHQNHHLDFTAEDIESFLGGLAHNEPGGNSTAASTEGATEGEATAAKTEGDITDEQKTAVRIERKRCREKQRRSDVNRQFTELTSTLRKVESESADWARHTYTSTTNRADLIARAIYILNAIHDSNELRKKRIVELERDLEQSKKAGEEAAAKLKEQMMAPQQMGGGKMVMMVPMMIGGESGPAAMPYGQMPFFMPQVHGTVPPMAPTDGSNMPQMPPYMMQHMMMAPQQMPNVEVQGDGKKKASTEEDYTNNVAHLA